MSNNKKSTVLEDIAYLINGKNAKKELISDSGISYLRGKDLQNGKIAKTDSFINAENEEVFSKCLLKKGDILLTKTGSIKMALVTDKDLPAIASDRLIIIRAFDITPKKLYSFLKSEDFNKQICKIQKGITVPHISLTALKKVIVSNVNDNK